MRNYYSITVNRYNTKGNKMNPRTINWDANDYDYSIDDIAAMIPCICRSGRKLARITHRDGNGMTLDFKGSAKDWQWFKLSVDLALSVAAINKFQEKYNKK